MAMAVLSGWGPGDAWLALACDYAMEHHGEASEVTGELEELRQEAAALECRGGHR